MDIIIECSLVICFLSSSFVLTVFFKSSVRNKCDIFVIVLRSSYPVFYFFKCSVAGIMLTQNNRSGNQSVWTIQHCQTKLYNETQPYKTMDILYISALQHCFVCAYTTMCFGPAEPSACNIVLLYLFVAVSVSSA